MEPKTEPKMDVELMETIKDTLASSSSFSDALDRLIWFFQTETLPKPVDVNTSKRGN